LVLREKALKGDARALDRLLELASRYNNDAGDTITQQLSADDQAILAAYVAEFAPAAVTSTPAELARRPRVELRRKFRSSPNEESSE
jgi:cytochrome c553